jgi:iron complex outermembrane receptor protein
MSDHNKSNRAAMKVWGMAISALLLLLVENSWANEVDKTAAPLENLSISDLMQIEISSVSRKSQTLSNTAAAVFVISQEDILRSGATSIPEALRYVPGLEVAQSGAHTWEITSRGFNGEYANKLLVLIDGRSVYTPLFSGVFWELQDTMMEDIERIEVIRGPGAVMWGANAVNGVINIITRKTKDTRGDLAVVGAGNQEHGFAEFRHGGSVGDNGSYRVYGKGFSDNATVNAAGQRQDDAWSSGQMGFRMDSNVSADDRLTLQGDAYSMSNGTPLTSNAVLVPPYTSYTPNSAPVHGGNLMARWESTFSNGSEMSLQSYYDRVQFNTLYVGEDTETYDIDFQYRLHPNAMNDLMWGANYRHIHNVANNTVNMSYSPSVFGYQNYNVFAQDDITLIANRLRLTLGAKEEDSYFSGMQFQPNARLMWTPDDINSVWLSASKASRIPDLNEAKGTTSLTVIPPLTPNNPTPLPIQLLLSPNPNLAAETVTALEVGYRTQWSQHLSTDIAAYSNDYHNIIQWTYIGGAPTPAPMPAGGIPAYLLVPMIYSNATTTTQTHGLEMSADWRALDWMRLEGAFTYTKINTPPWDGINYDFANLTPRTQESLRSLMDLSEKTKLNVALRHVGNLPATIQNVPAYTAADANVVYTPHKGLVFSLVGQNLFSPQHAEFIASGNPPSQIPRSIFAKVTWSH